MAPRRMLITAGPTHEPIDAVRYLANRSSGRMGLAVAAAAREAGWEVTLLLGPVPTDPPADVTVHRYESTAQLQARLDEHFAAADVLVMAAAVADYRPRSASGGGKIERQGEGLVLELEPTPDLVAGCAARKRPDQFIVAFALESPDVLEARAVAKLQRKAVDAIVANPLATMGDPRIDAMLLTAAGDRVAPGAMSKAEFAAWLVDQIAARVVDAPRR